MSQGSKDVEKSFQSGINWLHHEHLFQIIVATSVGAALIAPMLIMVLHPSRNTSVITTCVFVFAFASGLVIFNSLAYLAGASLEPFGIESDMLSGSMLQLKDIVGATAAYAAVLVVFVGVSTISQS